MSEIKFRLGVETITIEEQLLIVISPGLRSDRQYILLSRAHSNRDNVMNITNDNTNIHEMRLMANVVTFSFANDRID